MKCYEYDVVFPEAISKIEQKDEWFYLSSKHNKEKIKLTEYDRLFNVPGLFEYIYTDKLRCRSPQIVSDMLFNAVIKQEQDPAQLRVLDLGAGNGIIGEKLRKQGCSLIVGLDLLTEAKSAALRDRPGVYDDYLVANMASPRLRDMRKLKKFKFNAMITTAALGNDDGLTRAFLNTLTVLDTHAWIAFNVRDQILNFRDSSGYQTTIKKIIANDFSLLKEKIYCHRLSLHGDEIIHHAFVGRR